MTIVNPTGHFDPARQIGPIRATPAEQEQLIATWNQALADFAAGLSGGIPIPPIHHAYLPPGWSRDGGRYLAELPIEALIRGHGDQRWWHSDPLWNDGTGKGNGFAHVNPPVTAGAAPPASPPLNQSTSSSRAARAEHVNTDPPAVSQASTGPRSWWGEISPKARKQVKIAAAVAAVVLLIAIFG